MVNYLLQSDERGENLDLKENELSGYAKECKATPMQMSKDTSASILNPEEMSTPNRLFPAINDSFVSPPRSALKQILPTDTSQMLSPVSAGKKELNDAALALTWLSEACTTSTKDNVTPTQKKRGKMVALSPPVEHESVEQEGKSRKRAASQKCAAMLKEALLEEKKLNASAKAKIPQVSFTKGVKGKKGESGVRKRPRNYSAHSRVGRAVQSIYEYIAAFQDKHLAEGSSGVPERIIRLVFGNNPDTSKALRYLVSENRITRSGFGGRRDPFSYTIKNTGSNQSPQTSCQENGEPSQNQQKMMKTPPTTKVTSRNTDPAAAAAILTAPSTLKRQEPEDSARKSEISLQKSRRPLQPRLSFGGDAVKPSFLTIEMEGNKAKVASQPNAHQDIKEPLKARIIEMPLLNRVTAEKETAKDQGNINQQISALQAALSHNPLLNMPGKPFDEARQALATVQTAYLMQLHAAQMWWQSVSAASAGTADQRNVVCQNVKTSSE